MVRYIFGSERLSKESQAGAYSFFEAQLLTRPVRSNNRAYFNATSPKVIQNFLDTIENFGIDFDEDLIDELKAFSKLQPQKNQPLIFEDISNTILEDDKAVVYNFDTSKLQHFLGDNLALFVDSDFQALDLPVIARNKLENGKSVNLWYEEVVPKQSKFYFTIAKPDNIDESDKKIKEFDSRFENEGLIVQFGANRSIGYGFSRVKRVSK
jgi:CRISPR-associated protein Cmr4